MDITDDENALALQLLTALSLKEIDLIIDDVKKKHSKPLLQKDLSTLCQCN